MQSRKFVEALTDREEKEMILHIVYGISFAAWCGMFIVLPLYIVADTICDKLSKAKHYANPYRSHAPKPTYKIPVPETKREENKMKQDYICLDCGHTFTYNRRTSDGRRCPDCDGPIVPCTIGIDLASGKDCTATHKP